MWMYYQPNPCGRSVGDCSIRAVAKALNISWEEAYNIICDAGYKMCDMSYRRNRDNMGRYSRNDYNMNDQFRPRM